MVKKMNDYIHIENGIRLHVWETNKGPSLGLFRWKVWRWDNEAEIWDPVIGSNYPQTYDAALSEGKYHYALADARRQAQQVYVTQETKERLMREFGLTEADFY